jgi:hypothetical protein
MLILLEDALNGLDGTHYSHSHTKRGRTKSKLDFLFLAVGSVGHIFDGSTEHESGVNVNDGIAQCCSVSHKRKESENKCETTEKINH